MTQSSNGVGDYVNLLARQFTSPVIHEVLLFISTQLAPPNPQSGSQICQPIRHHRIQNGVPRSCPVGDEKRLTGDARIVTQRIDQADR